MSDNSDLISKLSNMQNKNAISVNKVTGEKPITGGANCTTVPELRNHLIANLGEVIDHYLNVATGKEDVKSTNHNMRQEVWELAKEIMTNSGQLIQIDGDGTPEGVLRAIEDGKCSIQDGEKLLKIYYKVKEIENIGKEAGEANVFPFLQFSVHNPHGQNIQGVLTEGAQSTPSDEDIIEG